MKTADLIDQARSASGIPSDYGIAKALGVSRQSISEWRSGVSYPGNLAVFGLAELARRDCGQVLAELEAEKAERTGRDEAAATWRAWLQKAGGVAASIMAAVILSGTVGAGNANASRHLGALGGVDLGYIGAHRRRRPGRRRAQVFAAMADVLAGGPVRAARESQC